MHWWALWIGVATVANKNALFVTLVDRIPRFDAHWSQFFAEFDWFVVITSRLDAYMILIIYMILSRDMAIFVLTTTTTTTTRPITLPPCACARGNKMYQLWIWPHTQMWLLQKLLANNSSDGAFTMNVGSLNVSRSKYMATGQGTIKVRGRECEDWLIQLANREGAWPKRSYEYFWSKVGVSRIGQGWLCACN